MAQGVKRPSHEWINDFPLMRKAIEVRQIIPAAAAKAYLNGYNKGKIPDWLSRQIDLQAMQFAASD